MSITVFRQEKMRLTEAMEYSNIISIERQYASNMCIGYVTESWWGFIFGVLGNVECSFIAITSSANPEPVKVSSMGQIGICNNFLNLNHLNVYYLRTGVK